jgi:hypothetical protein
MIDPYVSYEVQYFDIEYERWFNADESAFRNEHLTYEDAQAYKKQMRPLYSKMRIIRETVLTSIMETD